LHMKTDQLANTKCFVYCADICRLILINLCIYIYRSGRFISIIYDEYLL
jgi:hypothetical protein